MVSGSRRGISLVEVGVAMVVLAVGLLATVALVARAGAVLREAESREGAARAAEDVLDSLTQHGRPGPGAIVRGRYALDWRTSRDSAGVTRVDLNVRYDGGGRSRTDTFTTFAAPWPRILGHVP